MGELLGIEVAIAWVDRYSPLSRGAREVWSEFRSEAWMRGGGKRGARP